MAAGRFELKYAIEEERAREVSRYLRHYCRPDKELNGQAEYIVTSLYLDSPTRVLHRAVLNAQPNRFKARIRGYGERCEGPAWVEIKRRIGEVIAKERTLVPAELWPQLIDPFAVCAPETWGLRPQATKIVQDFHALCMSMDLRPAMGIRYNREPWTGLYDPDLRVTFDRSLRYCPTEEIAIPTDESSYRVYDAADQVARTRTPVILEIKFPTSIPAWLADVVRTLQLERGSFAKYSTAVELHLADTTATWPFDQAPMWA